MISSEESRTSHRDSEVGYLQALQMALRGVAVEFAVLLARRMVLRQVLIRSEVMILLH